MLFCAVLTLTVNEVLRIETFHCSQPLLCVNCANCKYKEFPTFVRKNGRDNKLRVHPFRATGQWLLTLTSIDAGWAIEFNQLRIIHVAGLLSGEPFSDA